MVDQWWHNTTRLFVFRTNSSGHPVDPSDSFPTYEQEEINYHYMGQSVNKLAHKYLGSSSRSSTFLSDLPDRTQCMQQP